MIIEELDNTVHWVDPYGAVRSATYREAIEPYIDETTTPHGAAPRYHRRGREIWTWGVLGNNPHRIETHDTPEEAERVLWENHIYDFEHSDDAPEVFNTRAAAEAYRDSFLEEEDGYEGA